MGEAADSRRDGDDFHLRLLTRGKSEKFRLLPPDDDPVARVMDGIAGVLLTYAATANDPRIAERARPEHVKVRMIPQAEVAALTLWHAPNHIVVVNQGLALFLYRLARAFSPHIIVRGPADPPAPPESEAIGIIATLIDWMASPVHAPLVDDWPIGEREKRTAENYTRMAERFVLGHEIGHIVRGHLIADTAEVGTAPKSPQELDERPKQQEIEADIVGSLLAVDSTRLEQLDPRAAVAGVHYFFRALQLGEQVGAIRVDAAHRTAEERLALCDHAMGERYGQIPELRRAAHEMGALLDRLATAAIEERARRRATVAAQMDDAFRTARWTMGERDAREMQRLYDLAKSGFAQAPGAVIEALGANLLDADAYTQMLNGAASREALDHDDRLRRHQIAHFIARNSPIPVRNVLGIDFPTFGAPTGHAA